MGTDMKILLLERMNTQEILDTLATDYGLTWGSGSPRVCLISLSGSCTPVQAIRTPSKARCYRILKLEAQAPLSLKAVLSISFKPCPDAVYQSTRCGLVGVGYAFLQIAEIQWSLRRKGSRGFCFSLNYSYAYKAII